MHIRPVDNIRARPQLINDILGIPYIFLVLDRMLQARPKVHGDSSNLYLDPYLFLAV